MDHDTERAVAAGPSAAGPSRADGNDTSLTDQDANANDYGLFDTNNVPFVQRFKLRAQPVPSNMARDFCMRERNYLSWIKVITIMFLLACAMFLELKMRTVEDMDMAVSGILSLANAHVPNQTTTTQRQHVFGVRSDTAPKFVADRGTRPEYFVLGTIYTVTAFLGYFASVYDYYNCITELENEHIYLDECEGHTHPFVTLTSALIIVVVLGTAILMLVQRE
ncbi:hypothetical protein MCUN1_002321 [Malassezia cuniculi]|uniref:DUF202 domain-containing protein n=1 Tax=Malassezia cuniculi TaxID=948313 RepID=A0AAF0EZB1_9BASI|nr:hypothetical protein MCUN1_002321 [Malassezia cuniculi]